ncbi:TIGD4 [Cordylochernes scorpioides]|uniref:TIGD4 n=1 Tax=Cordylochernes scorpioides TaxID=51811 RepID=A0ABY6L083_9ARAC|nr:TIGD4 [Cordylochernes scorpioides]
MAEAGVKIAKLILKKNQDPSLGLLEYRSTPLENGYSPAELLMGRKLRTTLPIAPENLNPKLVDSQTLKRKEGRRRKDMKSRYDRRCGATDMEELSEGERKQTRNSLSLSVKLQILREIEVEKKKKTDVAQKHNIPQSSLSTIIKNSEKIHQQALHAGESSRKRARGSTYADVDEALLQWFKQARSAALPVNGPLLSEKAKTLALEFGLKDFTGSGGWIERWKARHGIKLRNICGESADVNRETMTNWLTDVMPNIISNYACKDIFNADETGLFWRLLPDKTLHFKGETCTGGKASKERITILLCCNMDGSGKMQPLVIGKAKQPRCFRGIKHLPVQYEANQKAWMTGLLFESWVRHIDKKMAGQHRQIILLLDNCGAHPPDMQGSQILV